MCNVNFNPHAKKIHSMQVIFLHGWRKIFYDLSFSKYGWIIECLVVMYMLVYSPSLRTFFHGLWTMSYRALDRGTTKLLIGLQFLLFIQLQGEWLIVPYYWWHFLIRSLYIYIYINLILIIITSEGNVIIFQFEFVCF